LKVAISYNRCKATYNHFYRFYFSFSFVTIGLQAVKATKTFYNEFLDYSFDVFMALMV